MFIVAQKKIFSMGFADFANISHANQQKSSGRPKGTPLLLFMYSNGAAAPFHNREALFYERFKGLLRNFDFRL